jgi:hypothetical protein
MNYSLQYVEELGTVIVVFKGSAPAVSAGRDVIEAAGDLEAQWSGHSVDRRPAGVSAS